MPFTNGKGFGRNTLEKERLIIQLTSVHRKLCFHVFQKHQWLDPTYHLIDLTTGDGFSEARAVGSARLAKSYDAIMCYEALRCFQPPCAFHGIFIERNQVGLMAFRRLVAQMATPAAESATQLRFLDCDHCSVDFRALIPPVQTTEKTRYGLMVFDPNPGKENVASIETMGRVVSMHKKIDVLCYLSGTVFKRLAGIGVGPYLNVWEALQLLEKKYWLMSPLHGANQYAVFLGLNFPMGSWEKQGFVHCHSPEGQERLNKLRFTVKALKNGTGGLV